MSWLFAAALAQEPPGDGFQTARSAEAEGRHEDAVQACAGVIAARGPRAEACERRIAFLERRRDRDGTFGGWSALHAVREGYRDAGPDRRRAEVERIAGAPSTSEVVRAEAAIWLARDALAVDDPARAVRFTGAVIDVPLPDDAPVATQLGQVHAVALARLGRDEEAARIQEAVRVPVDPGAARPTPVEQVWTARRRRSLAGGSAAAVAAFVLLAVPLAVRGLRAGRLVPVGLVPIAVAGGTTAVLVYGRAPEVVASIGWMVGAFAVLHLLSADALRGAGSVGARVAVRLLAALATVGAGYLALWAGGVLMWVGG